MNVLKTLILVCMMAVFGACGLLQEKNQGALASTYATLYAFFETAAVGSVGCYPNTSDNNNYSPDNTLKAEYSFQVEIPSTMVACVKDTTVYNNINNNQVTMEGILAAHTVGFYVTNTAVNPGTFIAGLIRVPVLGTIQNTYVLGNTGTACPFNTADTTTHLVGKFNMESLTSYQYITAVDDSCGASVGSGLSPFYLAQQYGVSY